MFSADSNTGHPAVGPQQNVPPSWILRSLAFVLQQVIPILTNLAAATETLAGQHPQPSHPFFQSAGVAMQLMHQLQHIFVDTEQTLALFGFNRPIGQPAANGPQRPSGVDGSSNQAPHSRANTATGPGTNPIVNPLAGLSAVFQLFAPLTSARQPASPVSSVATSTATAGATPGSTAHSVASAHSNATDAVNPPDASQSQSRAVRQVVTLQFVHPGAPPTNAVRISHSFVSYSLLWAFKRRLQQHQDLRGVHRPLRRISRPLLFVRIVVRSVA